MKFTFLLVLGAFLSQAALAGSITRDSDGFSTSVQSASIVFSNRGYVVTVLGKSTEPNPTNGIIFKYNIPVASYADGSALVRDVKLGNVQCKGEPCILTYVNIPSSPQP